MKTQLEVMAVHFNYLTIMETRVLTSWGRWLPSPSPIAINIGAGAGTSTLALLLGHPHLLVISIDIKKAQLDLERRNLEWMALSDERHEQIQGDSAEVGRKWARGLIDLVFIDGDHNYAQVKKDIQMWLPHIVEGGIICGHDYGWEKWPGVKQAFDEEMVDFERISLTDHLIGFKV